MTEPTPKEIQDKRIADEEAADAALDAQAAADNKAREDRIAEDKRIRTALDAVTSPAPSPAPEPAPAPIPAAFLSPFAPTSPWRARPTAYALGDATIGTNAYYPSVSADEWSCGAFLAVDSDPSITVQTGDMGVVTIPHWPASVIAAAEADGHADVYDADTIHSFWQLKQANGQWTAGSYASCPISGTGWGTASQPRVGTRAVGVPATAGIIRTHELAESSSFYPHALALSLPGESLAKNATLPARMTDGDPSGNTGSIPYGAHLMLPANFDLSRITNAQLRKVASTLMIFGAYVVDRNVGTPFNIFVELHSGFNLMPGGWDNEVASELQLIRASLAPVKSSSGWIDADGQPFTPDWIAAPEPPAPGPVETPPAPQPAPPPVPDPTPLPDAASLRDTFEHVTGAHIGYKDVPDAAMSSLPQTDYPDGSFGPFPSNITGTGERPDIGIVPAWDALAVAMNDARATKYSSIVSKIAASMPIHNTSKATGQLITYRDFPRASFNGDPGGLDGIDFQPNPMNWGINDTQHQPHFLFVPFLDAYRNKDVAVARRILNDMLAFCTWNYLQMPYSGRGFERGIFATQMSFNDLRGSGWGNLTQFQTLAATKLMKEIDATFDHPLIPDLVNSVQWNIKWAAETFLMDTPVFDDDAWGGAYYDLPNGRLKNSLTVFTNTNLYNAGDGYVRIGAFQQHFFSQSFQFAYGMAKQGYLPIDALSFDYLKKVALACGAFAVRLCGDGSPGTVDFRRGAHAYDLAVGWIAADGLPRFFSSDAELAIANWDRLGPLPPDTDIRIHNTNDKLDFIQDGFAADIMPVLAFAVRDGADNAQAAWDRYFGSATVQRSRGHWPLEPSGFSIKYAYTPAGVWIDDATVIDPPAPSPGPAPSPPAPSPAPAPPAPPPVVPTGGTFKTARSVSLNTMHDVDPCPNKGCAWSGLGLAETMRVWCGWTPAPEYGSKGAIIGAGMGGHASYDGNEAYAYDIDSSLMVRHGDPSVGPIVDGEYPDQSPATRHTYGMIVYMPPAWGGGPKGSVLLLGAPGASNPFTHRVHAMDLATGKWRRFVDNLASIGGSFGNSYGSAVRDDRRFGWWVVPSVGNVSFVSKDATVTQHAAGTNSGGQSMAVMLEDRDVLLNLDHGVDWSTGTSSLKLSRLDLANPNAFVACTQTGPVPDYRYGLAYDGTYLVSYEGKGGRDITYCKVLADLSGSFDWQIGTIAGEAPVYESGNPNGHWRRLVHIGGKFWWVESANAAVQVFE